MKPATTGPDQRSLAVLADGAPWELAVLAAADRGDLPPVRRCVDVADLMATATIGTCRAALVDVAVLGLDAEFADRLASSGLAWWALGPADHPDRGRLETLGGRWLILESPADAPAAVLRALTAAPAPEPTVPTETTEPTEPFGPFGSFGPFGPSWPRTEGTADVPFEPTHGSASGPGSDRPSSADRELAGCDGVVACHPIIAVWGPQGAPGRTTTAIEIAAALAGRGSRVILVDADPVEAGVAARLGLLEETSGLLALARHANAGTLRPGEVGRVARRVAGIEVVTGLPRPEGRAEVRPGALARVLRAAAGEAVTVVDLGPGLESDNPIDRITLEGWRAATATIAVGLPEPNAVARLLRGLVRLHSLAAEEGEAPPALFPVINRYRASLGWLAADLKAVVARAAGRDPILIPDDVRRFDRGQRLGLTLSESGGSAARDAFGVLADQVLPSGQSGLPRRRRAAGVRPRYRRPSRPEGRADPAPDGLSATP